MTTTSSHSLTQLAQIVSALENKARNPSSKAVALRAIERHAAQIGLSGDDVLDSADGLLSGRLSAADWRAQLGDASAESEKSPEDEAEGAGRTGADAPAAETMMPEADNQDGEPPASIDALQGIAAISALPALGGAQEPSVKQQLLAACQAAERWLRAQHDPSEGGDEILGALRAAIARAGGEPRQRSEPGTPRQPRENSKEAQVIALLRQPQGVTLAQIGALTGWQAHSIRGFFAGALKKRRGMQVTSEKTASGERRYRIADGCC